MNYAELLNDLEGMYEEFDTQKVKIIVDGEIFEAKKIIDLNGDYYITCDEDY